MDFSQLQAYMDKHSKRLEEALTETVKTTVDDVILHTPIDTGNARYNWQASIGRPVSSILNYFGNDGEVNHVHAGLPSPAYYSAMRDAENDIESAYGNVFYLMNNLDYIRNLEYGQSGQSDYMLHKAVMLFGERFNENLRNK